MRTDNPLPLRLPRACVLILGCLLANAATAANSSFDAGVTASKQGDYRQAIEHFLDARAQGVNTPALYHNLGVAYYKLGRYPEARNAFMRAVESPKMRALSFYNLGLVAEKQNDDTAARDWFEKAYDAATTGKLRRLAAAQLGLAENDVSRYTLYLEGFAGHDSNPRLTEQDTDQLGERRKDGDTVYGALAVGQLLLAGDWSGGATAIGAVYADAHPDLDDQDIGAYTAGLGLHHSPGRWRHEYSLTATRLRLGGETLQTSVRGEIHSKRYLATNLIAGLRLRSESIDGEDQSGFDYLSGWRHQARLRLRDRGGPWRWNLYYEYEYNNRDDLFVDTDTGTDFFSVSPTRHEIGAGLERTLVGKLTGEVRLAFRRSEYRDPEIRSGVEREEREDDRLEAGLGLSHPLGRWTGRIETTYWDNTSECGDGACDRFEYDRLETLISVGRSF